MKIKLVLLSIFFVLSACSEETPLEKAETACQNHGGVALSQGMQKAVCKDSTTVDL